MMKSIKERLYDIESLASEGAEDYGLRTSQDDIDTYNTILSHVQEIWQLLRQPVAIYVTGGHASVESGPLGIQVIIEDAD